MKSVWEPASCLSPELVAEYEEGVQRELVDDVFSSGGESLYILFSSGVLAPSLPKRPRIIIPTPQDDSTGISG